MFKLFAVVFAFCAVLACSVAEAKPAVLVDAAPAVVTATSSQYVARNFNGIAAAPIVAAAYTAPVAAAPVAAAYTAPVAAAPVAAAYTAPVASVAYPYSYPYTAAYTTYL